MAQEKLFSIRGKVALVTGGSRGIGELIVRGLAEAGATVYVVSRTAEVCEQLAAELTSQGADVVALPADVATVEGCRVVVDAFEAHRDSLDILVANAGTTWTAPLSDYSVEGWDKVFDLNIRSIFLLVQGLSPALRRRATAADPARIITIGSGDGIRTPKHEAFAYSAAKAGLHQFSRHLAQELAADHVNVNVIAPGYFSSKMTTWLFDDPAEVDRLITHGVPVGRAGVQDDIAGPVIWLASRAGAYVTGTVIPVDGGYTNQ